MMAFPPSSRARSLMPSSPKLPSSMLSLSKPTPQAGCSAWLITRVPSRTQTESKQLTSRSTVAANQCQQQQNHTDDQHVQQAISHPGILGHELEATRDSRRLRAVEATGKTDHLVTQLPQDANFPNLRNPLSRCKTPIFPNDVTLCQQTRAELSVGTAVRSPAVGSVQPRQPAMSSAVST